jgi:hypothetical protein
VPCLFRILSKTRLLYGVDENALDGIPWTRFNVVIPPPTKKNKQILTRCVRHRPELRQTQRAAITNK